jgi:hypothetical protein
MQCASAIYPREAQLFVIPPWCARVEEDVKRRKNGEEENPARATPPERQG